MEKGKMWESKNADGSVVYHYSTKETAVEIRKALKAEYPDIKFSVRSDVYSGGSAVRISFDSDHVSGREVREKMQLFAGATFDGMTDYKDYKPSMTYDGKIVQWGADWVDARNDADYRRIVDQVNGN